MKNVGIICGGFSSEFDISVKSGTNIYDNFPEGYKAYLILLRDTGWFVKVGEEELPMDSRNLSFRLNGEDVRIDLAIVYIHGNPGENGKLQAYLDIIGVPYVNSGPLASELSFDKWYCNQFLKGFGIQVADSIYLTSRNHTTASESIVKQLGLPLFVKPCDSGSSYGIARVNTVGDLSPAIDSAFNEGATVIIESFLDGTEVTCGVYRTNEGIRALPLTEIVTENEFFDYEAKYQGLSDEITPARIPDDQTKEVQELSIKIYQLLNLRSIARIDFMMVGGKPNVIEVNTTPGFSNESIVPKMIATKGLTTKEFWTQILDAEL